GQNLAKQLFRITPSALLCEMARIFQLGIKHNPIFWINAAHGLSIRGAADISERLEVLDRFSIEGIFLRGLRPALAISQNQFQFSIQVVGNNAVLIKNIGQLAGISLEIIKLRLRGTNVLESVLPHAVERGHPESNFAQQ